MKTWIFITVIILLAAGCATGGYAFAAKSSQLGIANHEIEELTNDVTTLSSEISNLSSDISNLNLEKANLEEENEDLQVTLEETQSDLDVAEGRITTLQINLTKVQNDYQSVISQLSELQSFYDGIFMGEAPPYYKPDNQLMNIIDNPSAQDPTWQQLVNFLNADQTDRQEYVLGEYVCSGFTEDVHNNAESAGIRCAVVWVAFEDMVNTHVLNAFNTVDKGLVFIDCTGVTGYSSQSWDRVAYLQIGEQYGCLALVASIPSFEYEYYKAMSIQLEQRIAQCEIDVANYNAQVVAFNAEVDAYIEAVEAYNQNPTYPEYLRLTAWYNDLQIQSSILSAQATVLNQELYELGLQYDSFGGVLGIVEEVKMYW